jgi:hypothetical protein
MEIFRRRFGFRFPEISHWHRHGAAIHIHQFMPTRREQIPAGEGCLILLRDPVDRFESAFREKVLFNECFDSADSIVVRLLSILEQVKCDSFESRILRDHFRPQSFWIEFIQPGDRLGVSCDDIGQYLRIEGRRVNDSRFWTERSQNTEMIEALRSIIRKYDTMIRDVYPADQTLCDTFKIGDTK